MTCPLHESIQKMLADGGVSGGSVNGVAGDGLLLAASAMLGGVSPFPDEGEADARVNAALSIPLELRDEWAREQLDALIVAAQKDGAEVGEIAGGFGGVMIEKGGRILYYVPTADTSSFVDGFYVDELTRTVTVQITEKGGAQRLYTYYNVSHEEMMGFIATAALARTKTPEEYTLVALRLMYELGTDSVTSAVLLKIIQGKVGGVEVETEDGRRVLRPAVGSYFNHAIKDHAFTEIGSTARCPDRERPEECLTRRRRRLVLDYENGVPRIRTEELEEEGGVREQGAAEEDTRGRVLMRNEINAMLAVAAEWIGSDNALMRAETLGLFADLIRSGELTEVARHEAMEHITNGLEDEDRDVRRYAVENLAYLIRSGALTETERDQALRHILRGAEDEDGDVRFFTFRALDEIIRSVGFRKDEVDNIAQCVLKGMDDGYFVVPDAAIELAADLVSLSADGLGDAKRNEIVRRIMKELDDRPRAGEVNSTVIKSLAQLTMSNALTQDEEEKALRLILDQADGDLSSTALWALSEFILRDKLTPAKQHEWGQALGYMMKGAGEGGTFEREAAIKGMTKLILSGKLAQGDRDKAVRLMMERAGKPEGDDFAISSLAELVLSGELSPIERYEAVGIFFKRMDGGRAGTPGAATESLVKLVQSGELTRIERNEFIKRTMRNTRNEDLSFDATDALVTLIISGDLSREEQTAALNQIMDNAKGGNPYVRSSAIWALADLLEHGKLTPVEQKDAMKYAVEGLSSAEPNGWIIRKAAIELLAQLVQSGELTPIEHHTAVEHILESTRHPSSYTREDAVSYLTEKLTRRNALTPSERRSVTERILEMAKNEENVNMRIAAIEALGRIVAPE